MGEVRFRALHETCKIPKYLRMKIFEIITEAEARVLERGEVVTLARGGHVTPLARDTLKERRIVVVSEELADETDGILVPEANIRAVAVAADHNGAPLARMLEGFLRGRGLAVQPIADGDPTTWEYPDAAEAVAVLVARGEVDAGIVVDGAGIGSAIAANKVKGVRAAMVTTETMARYARQHNGANVLTLGSSLISEDEARAIVVTWLTTAMREPRYIRRLAKIRRLERRQ